MRVNESIMSKTKRGDTIIEVMLAFAVFALIAVLSVSMMNMGLSTGERSLELVTARNELNAQAEALRFIHSSYIAEDSLPKCNEVEQGKPCQQYAVLWDAITQGARSSSANEGDPDRFDIEYPLDACHTVYEEGNARLIRNNAFIINTRQLLANGIDTDYGMLRDAVIRASTSNTNIFVEPTLNARIIYTRDTGVDSEDDNSTINLGGSKMQEYLRVAKVEGIWVVAVAGPRNRTSEPQYYDFYIETCWYGSNSPAPSSLDAVIRLYNPKGA